MNRHPARPVLFVVFLLVSILACNFTPSGSDDDRSATVEAMTTSVAATSTALSLEGQTTPEVVEVQATATQAAVEVQVTEDLQATEATGNLAATEAALAPIKAELSLYGVDPERGQLAWVHPPLTVEIDQYMGRKFDNQFPTVVVQDFVMSADITWDTQYGAAGCAFVFRSDGNQSKPNQYMVWMTRLTDGRIDFMVFAEGEIVGLKDFYANGIDPNFKGANGATNKLAIVGQGKLFTIYTNGEKIGTVDPEAPMPPLVLPKPPAKPPNILDPVARAAYERAVAEYRQAVSKLKNEYNRRVALAKKANKNFPAGIVAMGAMAESGYTKCEFNNAWLWHISP